jgi:hypothetical protein
VIPRLAVQTFFLFFYPYKQTYENSNNYEIIRRMIYGVQLFIRVLLLRTLRFPEIRTCKTTDELGWVMGSRTMSSGQTMGLFSIASVWTCDCSHCIYLTVSCPVTCYIAYTLKCYLNMLRISQGFSSYY